MLHHPDCNSKTGSYLLSAPGEGPAVFREENAIKPNLKYMCWRDMCFTFLAMTELAANQRRMMRRWREEKFVLLCNMRWDRSGIMMLLADARHYGL